MYDKKEALYFAMNKLNEIKESRNLNDIEEVQAAIWHALETMEIEEEEAAAKQKKFDEAMKDSNRILNEMLEIAERGLRA